MPGSRHPLEAEVQQLVDGSDGGSRRWQPRMLWVLPLAVGYLNVKEYIEIDYKIM